MPLTPHLATAPSDPRLDHHHVVLGAGPVGRALAAQLVEHGIRPTIVTRSATLLAGAATRRADLSDPTAAKEALADADVVYQCAQPEYHRWRQDFPALQRSIVDGAASSGAVVVAVENMYGYGPVDAALHEALPLDATTNKGAVRAQLWHQLQTAHDTGTVRAVAARAADFYGPGVTDSMLGQRFFGPLIDGKRAEIVGDPERLHTVTYVPDLAAAMIRLGSTPDAWGRAWHVPNAPTVTTAEIVALAASAAGRTPATRRLRPWQLRLAGRFVPAAREVVEMLYEFDHDFVVDHSAYGRRFGDGATSLQDGLAATVAWYRSDRP